MTRKKVKLAYITNDSARKATYKKRKKGLIKKVSELSTLCDIQACAIIYSQYESQPEVWPSPMGAQRIIAQFKTMPEMEQSKKMVNQETFLRQRIAKVNEQLKKQRRENREKEMTKVMFQCLTGKPMNGLSMIDLNDLGWMIDQNLKEISNMIKSRKEEELPDQKVDIIQASSQVAPTPAAVAVSAAIAELGMEKQCGENMNMNMMNMNMHGFEMNNMQETMQRPHPWLLEMMNMNQQEHMGFGHPAGEEMMPFGEQNHHAALWPNNNPYFP